MDSTGFEPVKSRGLCPSNPARPDGLGNTIKEKQWTRRDLNPWPSRCKRDDLPLIYEPAAAGCGILFFSGFHIVVTDQVATRQMNDENKHFLNHYAKADH